MIYNNFFAPSPDELLDQGKQNAQTVYPWGQYQGGAADLLNTLYPQLLNRYITPDNTYTPDKLVVDNPYQSTSGLQAFLDMQTAPQWYSTYHPFDSTSGIEQMLGSNGALTPNQVLMNTPFQSASAVPEFLTSQQDPLSVQAKNPFVDTSGMANSPSQLDDANGNPALSYTEAANSLLSLLTNPDSVTQSSAYKFRLNQGMEALDRQLGASGKLLSGNRMQALSDYAQQSASQEFENEYNRRMQTLQQALTGQQAESTERQGVYDRQLQAYNNSMDRNLNSYIQELNSRLQMRGQDQDLYSNIMNLYNQGYANEANARLGLYNAQQNLYTNQMNNYLQGYSTEGQLRAASENANQNAYFGSANAYNQGYQSQNQNNQWYQQLNEALHQNDISTLLQLAGVNPTAQLGALEALQGGQKAAQQQDQNNATSTGDFVGDLLGGLTFGIF
jgi:hypothetical protein